MDDSTSNELSIRSQPNHDCLTVVENVYHRPSGEEATCVESRFSRKLKTINQVYVRHCKATEEWQPLDTGWLDGCSALHIQNRAGTDLQVIPTDEEREMIIRQILEVSYCTSPDDAWLVYPGESMRASPRRVKDLQVRLVHRQSGEVRFNICLIPE